MNTHNYVARAWENRFLIQQRRSTGERFAVGFALGAIITGAAFLWLDVAGAQQLQRFVRIIDIF